MLVLDEDFVRRHLTYDACIPLMRRAMTDLSAGRTIQPLRSVLHLADGRAFGVMPGALAVDAAFGAKLVSVLPENFAKGRRSHQGLVVLFDPATGAVAALVHAGEVTRIRTACASAAATDALARPEASRLAVLGYGEQAEAHIEAISRVRALAEVRVWGRSADRAQAFVERVAEQTGLIIRAVSTAEEAVCDADIVCTVTAAAEPVLAGGRVAGGTHVNVVGSSYAGPREVDDELVRRSRFFADYAPGVMAQGAEFLSARAAGVVEEDHLVGEIGQVFSGDLPGRLWPSDVTLYKSLGHVAQDLASAAYLIERARAAGGGIDVAI